MLSHERHALTHENHVDLRRVEVRRGHLGLGVVAGDVAVAQVVGQGDDDVEVLCLRLRSGQQYDHRHKHQEKCGHGRHDWSPVRVY